MKKVLLTLSIVVLASCTSNKTFTSSSDTLTCKDSACVDSLGKCVKTDSLVTEVKELEN